MMQAKTKRDEFSYFHPVVNLVYFTLVLGFTVVLRHPASQLISLVCAVLYTATARGTMAAVNTMKISLPVILLTALINPVFNHQGVTMLCYLPWGNPLTLESILYGISAGAVLAASLLWFVNINRVFTSDKFVYLFGRIIPSLSLLLSMTLRFVPLFRKRLILVSESRKCVGRDISKGGVIARMKNAASVFSIAVTWSLENSVDTSDSMKSRGYGLKGRSAYRAYRFEARDRAVLCAMCVLGAFILFGRISKGLYFRYFPSVKWVGITPLTVSFQIAYLLLCLTPVLVSHIKFDD